MCFKVPYCNYDEAKRAFNKIRAMMQKGKKKNIRKEPQNIYQCNKCGFWHLTSMTLNEYQAMKKRITLKRYISSYTIKTICCEHFGVTIEEIESSCRKREIIKARQAAMWLMRKVADFKLVQIVEQFSARDHTTVIHALQTVQNSIDCKDDYLYYDLLILEAECIIASRMVREIKKEIKPLSDPQRWRSKWSWELFTNCGGCGLIPG